MTIQFCPYCQISFEPEEALSTKQPGIYLCPRCKAKLHLGQLLPGKAEQTPYDPIPNREAKKEIAEELERKKAQEEADDTISSPVEKAFLWIVQILFKPSYFFKYMGNKSVIATIYFSIFCIIIILLLEILFGFTEERLKPQKIATLLFVSVISPVILHIQSSITHLLILLFRAKNNGYWNSFKVIGFSWAAYLFCFSYFLFAISIIWKFVIETRGLAKVHNMDTFVAFCFSFLSFIINILLLYYMKQIIN